MNLVDRVKQILLSPRTEWPVIDAEQTTPAQLYAGYIMPLAAVGPIARIVGYSVFGITVPFVGTYRVPIGTAITSSLVSYALTLAGIYILALIIDGMASTFNGQRSLIQALKLAAYSSTAAWLAGILLLVPGLRPLTVLGLYSFYLLYLGVPVLMRSPREKAVTYSVVIVLAAIVLFMLIGIIAGRFMAVPTAGITVP
jgi:hypothetical protein